MTDITQASARVLIRPILSEIDPARILPRTLNNARVETAAVAETTDIPTMF